MDAEALVCPICKMFGCDCPPEPQPAVQDDLCAICRRNKLRCICASCLQPPEFSKTHIGEAMPAKTAERKADLDMAHYFNRDAVGMRKRLVELHTMIAELRDVGPKQP